MIETSDTIELTVPAKADYIGVIRLTTSGIANRMGFSYDDIEDIKVAVSEAATNAVNHAYKGEQGGVISIRMTTFADRMEIMVMDTGRSFDFEHMAKNMKPLDPSAAFEDLSEGGLGLYLIDTLMDRVSINNDSGVAVYMTKFLQRDEVELHDDRLYESFDRPVGG
ncbi:serine/threonine-protein kinase RsbW [Pullulanibacillus pueri]|uniref:Serine-protein kinase RsbW n=1 Tax=Pullulanibacillus pueri TaxID=1437324 RepID=A0A8J3ENS4_9BACL|nr:anti-sigma B factor RsbW [Pullulanibacillus pueri]MBM7683791.1 serine/threonine-protein kinase RsbW [Pullulanibacillus pueri]GGH87607.1 serine-protein kinase RsbW [Pullulanibacillus pueri]